MKQESVGGTVINKWWRKHGKGISLGDQKTDTCDTCASIRNTIKSYQINMVLAQVQEKFLQFLKSMINETFAERLPKCCQRIGERSANIRQRFADLLTNTIYHCVHWSIDIQRNGNFEEMTKLQGLIDFQNGELDQHRQQVTLSIII